MKSCTSQKRKTHRAGRTGHTGRLPVAENANQVTAFLRSLANLPSLLSLDTQSHCVSPIEMKYVPPYFILDMPSRFECHSNCYFWIVSSCVQNLLGQAPAASSLHALRPARGQCLGLIWRVLKLMTDGHLPQAKLQSEFQFSLSHFPGTAKIRLELKFEHFVHMCVCKGVSQSSPHQVPGQLPGLALYSAWFHRWTPPMSPPDKRDMPFAKWQAVCLWKFLPNRTVGKFVWQLFHEKKHHRSRSTGKPRLYHDSLKHKHRQFPQIHHSQHGVPVLAISVVQQMEQRCPLAGHEVMLIWITQTVWAHAGHKRYTARVLMWSNWSCTQCLVCKCARMLDIVTLERECVCRKTFSRFVIIIVGAAP